MLLVDASRSRRRGGKLLVYSHYVLSIQYFNQVISAKPYLFEPYFFRGLAKINLEDYQGAEADCDEAIRRNPFVVGAYQIRGLARIRQNNFDGAIEDYRMALKYEPEFASRMPKLGGVLAGSTGYDPDKAGFGANLIGPADELALRN